jgi:hypothetical protein
MRVLWCWRCGMELPMLDDDEWAVIQRAWTLTRSPGEALAILAREAGARGLPPPRPVPRETGGLARRLWPLSAAYEMFTGVAGTNPNAVAHHRVSIYGPPCPECGKPLRTPRARCCAACGWGMERLSASA